MKLFDSNLEILAIKTLLESSRGGLKLLAKLKIDFFGHEPAKEIIARIHVMVNNGKGIPNIELLKRDQALTENAKLILNSDTVALEADSDIQQCEEKLLEYRNTRILYESLKKSIELMQGNKPEIKQVIELMGATVSKCATGVDKVEMEHIEDSDPDAYDPHIDETLSGTIDNFLPTGYRFFDKEYGGLSKGNVLLLAAPSGKGKSAMMLRMAVLQYMMGLNVLVVSFEMTNSEMRERIFSSITKLDHTDIRLKRLINEQKALVKKKVKEFISTGAGNRLTLWGTSEDMTIADIRAYISHMGYHYVYIDYIGLIKVEKGKEQHQVLGDIIRDCKLMAKANEQAVIPLAQLDDETLKIKYSKAIKANCDFIWAWELNEAEKQMGIVKINQYKVRHGPEVPFYLRADLARMDFSDYDGPIPEFAPKEDKKPMPKMNVGN